MEHILPWLALKNVSGVGNHLYKRLMDRFHSPEQVFDAPKFELMTVPGINERIADAIKGYVFPDSLNQEIDLARRRQIRIITCADPEYPPLLQHIPDPPPVLYVKGVLSGTDVSVAVVGSRNASRYGISMARRLSRDLAARGLPIVSGMARGVDTAAHEGALSGGGRTFAVLGCGLGIVYPPENQRLYHQIIETGAVISEFPVLEEPNAYNFPARNRIIAGMTLGTIVVEAAKRSGSLITARLAAEQGREVFAVPGSVDSARSVGVHNLLKQGAKLVAGADDVIEEFYQFQPPARPAGGSAEMPAGKEPAPPPDLSPEETLVLDALDAYPAHIDDLSRQTGMDVVRLSIILLNLELKGMASQHPGKYFTVRGEKN